MEFEAGQPSEQDAGDVVQEAAERALVELVNVRHMEVERLERELEELRAHCEHLFQSFSVPTFPPGNSCHVTFLLLAETNSWLRMWSCTPSSVSLPATILRFGFLSWTYIFR